MTGFSVFVLVAGVRVPLFSHLLVFDITNECDDVARLGSGRGTVCRRLLGGSGRERIDGSGVGEGWTRELENPVARKPAYRADLAVDCIGEPHDAVPRGTRLEISVDQAGERVAPHDNLRIVDGCH